MASAGVSTPARLRPVSHSTTTESGRPEAAAACGNPAMTTELSAATDVADAGLRHHCGLAEFLAGDAFGAGGDLKFRQQRTLVGLDVRPIGDAGGIAGGLDPRDVALDAVHVDDSGGRAIFAGDLGGEGGGHQVDSNFSILVIASEAEQSTFPRCRMDCFVAALLAMTPESIPWLKLVRSLHVTLQAPAICLRPPANPFALS